MLRLTGELAAARAEGTTLVAGGGATNAVCLHRARDAGLGGFEFACAIPGTAGGGVWMNAGAYGSDWSAILVRALVATADGTGWLTPAASSASRTGTRTSSTATSLRGRVSARERDPAEIRAEISDLVARRKATQPTNEANVRLGLQEPAGEIGAGRMLELCGLKGHRHRRRT